MVMAFGSGRFPARASSDGSGECSRVEGVDRGLGGRNLGGSGPFCFRGGMGGDVRLDGDQTGARLGMGEVIRWDNTCHDVNGRGWYWISASDLAVEQNCPLVLGVLVVRRRERGWAGAVLARTAYGSGRGVNGEYTRVWGGWRGRVQAWACARVCGHGHVRRDMTLRDARSAMRRTAVSWSSGACHARLTAVGRA
ncbi:hypothetical protein GUJ93_ZPchr0012g19914 [Zizania palustris]|uniref:Uncharacterized protein n=1 Tax=Zizania palustris TaxID=103762 RepID=A0A8J5WRN4_ZIZPA|nr:hypothetical protein GUJ93_ZPchr0012g19914 [Zizania palustris]